MPDRGTHGELHLDAEHPHPLAERLLVREFLDELRPGLQLLRERGDDDAVPERARIRLDGRLDLLRPRREDAMHLRVRFARICGKRRHEEYDETFHYLKMIVRPEIGSSTMSETSQMTSATWSL